MGPTVLPANPKFATESEREVWRLLCHKLRPEDVVLANLRLTNRDKDHEADLIVLMPGVGIVVVEVKGGSVWIRMVAGTTAAGTPRSRSIRSNRHAATSSPYASTSRWTRAGAPASSMSAPTCTALPQGLDRETTRCGDRGPCSVTARTRARHSSPGPSHLVWCGVVVPGVDGREQVGTSGDRDACSHRLRVVPAGSTRGVWQLWPDCNSGAGSESLRG